MLCGETADVPFIRKKGRNETRHCHRVVEYMLCLRECFDGTGVLPKRIQIKKYAKFSPFLNQAGREEEKNHAV